MSEGDLESVGRLPAGGAEEGIKQAGVHLSRVQSREYQVIIGVFKLGNDQGYLSGDHKITNLGYNQGGILGSFWSTNWDTIWDSYLGSIRSTSWVSIWVQTGEQ